MPVIPLPQGYTWGFVVARSIHAMADTTKDWNRYPEARGSRGRVTFKPLVRRRSHEEDPTAFVHYEVATARFENGTMIDAEGLPGIYLISGYYNVSFQIEGGSIPGFDIEVTENHTKENPLDLVTAVPIVVPPGYVEVVRISDRIRAEAAAEAAEGYAEDAEGYAEDARQFSQTETFEGYISAAEEARDLANQYQSSASESATSATQSANQAEEARDATTDLASDLQDSIEDLASESYVDSEVSTLKQAAEDAYEALLVGRGENLIADPLYDRIGDIWGERDPGLWQQAEISRGPVVQLTPSSIRAISGDTRLNQNRRLPVQPGERFDFEATAWIGDTGTGVNVCLNFYETRDGGYLGRRWFGSPRWSGRAWRDLQGVVEVPDLNSGATLWASLEFFVYENQDAAGNVTILPAKLRRIQSGRMIVDGLLSAPPEVLGEFFDRTIRTWVNAKEYGATGDGETDDTEAILDAIGSGGRAVFFPAGEYRFSESITIPSNTEIIGAGRSQTVFKITDDAPVTMWCFTNRNKQVGDHNIVVRDLTLNWNIERTGSNDLPATGGGSTGSCLTLGHVTNARVQNVDLIGGGRHGLDITSASVSYPYNGDMPYTDAQGPSRFIWIENCYATNWADDGFTTHHSEYIWITNCRSDNPRRRGNQNGFEIDDGSTHVFLTNNWTEGCYSGIEIKAHDNAPAPREIYINGHVSLRDCRSYNWRHIGHHSGSDPRSQSAFDITAVNLLALYPTEAKGFQSGNSPRGLVISAYQRVSVTNLTIVGEPGKTYNDTLAALAVQYRARGITFNGVNITGFNGASSDIYIGGANHRVKIIGLNIEESADRAIAMASGAGTVSIYGADLVAPDTSRTTTGIDADNNSTYRALYVDPGTSFFGYDQNILFGGIYYEYGDGLQQRPSNAPSGLTSLADTRLLRAGRRTYLSTGVMSNLTDAPDVSGAYLYECEMLTNTGSLIQTLTRNTTGTNGNKWYRVIHLNGGEFSPWIRLD